MLCVPVMYSRCIYVDARSAGTRATMEEVFRFAEGGGGGAP